MMSAATAPWFRSWCWDCLRSWDAAFALGFLVAATFPRRGPEEQLAEQGMDRAEPVKQQLMESAKRLPST